jgi:arginine decarboxylase
VITAKQSVSDAEELFADAVGAKQAVFTTCGSSISIHTALLTVNGPGKKILVDRNVHKSVVASLILASAEPVWLRPRWTPSARSPTLLRPVTSRRCCGGILT